MVDDPADDRSGGLQASQLFDLMLQVPDEGAIAEVLADEIRATDQTAAALLLRTFGPEIAAASVATGCDEQGGMYFGVPPASPRLITMPAIGDPPAERDGPIAVMWLVAVWNQVMIVLHPQGPRQREGVETEPVDGAFADAAARAVRRARASDLEVRSAPALRRRIHWRGCVEVGVDDVFEPTHGRLARRVAQVEMRALDVTARQQLQIIVIRSDGDVVVEPERMGHLQVAAGTPERRAHAAACCALRIAHTRDG